VEIEAIADSTKMMSGNFMSLFEKRDGKYICIRDMGSSDHPIQKIKKLAILSKLKLPWCFALKKIKKTEDNDVSIIFMK
jgi:hypothetical protein